ncbi:MAG: hypothetical protein JSY10_20950 [Paenibacillus sp.]|nr:hypothetical protein [Paenibacillus sp.]
MFLINENLGAAKTKSSSVKHYGANEQVASLGVNILLQLFKYHDVVRSEILEQITSRIVSRSDSVMDFLRLLQHIIQEYPDEVEKYLTNVIYCLKCSKLYIKTNNFSFFFCRLKIHWISFPFYLYQLHNVYFLLFNPSLNLMNSLETG